MQSEIKRLLDENMTLEQKRELISHITERLCNGEDGGIYVFSDRAVAPEARKQYSIKSIEWSVLLKCDSDVNQDNL